MHFFFMIHCYSLFSFKTPLLVSFSVEVKREKTLTGCFSINRFFSFIATAWLLKKLMNEKYIFDAACKTTLKKGPWNWHMPLSWTDCHFFYTQPLKKNLTLTDNFTKWSCLVFFFLRTVKKTHDIIQLRERWSKK